jgi:predicted RNA-binding protein YlqC (UPF0109 family)
MASETGPRPSDARSLCEYLVRRLVDEPDAVSVAEEATDEGTVLRVTVAPDDRGKVIGRQGRVVRALRTVVRAGGVRASDRIQLEIVE